MMKQPCVYMLANRRHGTLYVGVTSDLATRISTHQTCVAGSFTSRYDIRMLVWYETHPTMESAIQRESALKNWRRQWKIRLIEKANPEWNNLAADLV